jgi:N-formylglutamate deformylase
MTGGLVTYKTGDSPLILSMPHDGTEIPPDIGARLNETGRSVPDTDWWMNRLYDGVPNVNPSIVRAHLSRYVIDVNRDPSGTTLYPGQATTGLCPTTTFDGEPIYLPGQEPDEAEVARRRDLYFAPYHAALARAIEDVKARHGYCLLYDCHSIRSEVPRLFDGTLPVFNIGTNEGAACAPAIEQAVAAACAGSEIHDCVVNGRFKGGWITRHYGRPENRVHAVQMELAQRAYMREAPPWDYLEDEANKVRPVLGRALEAMLAAGAEIEGARP